MICVSITAPTTDAARQALHAAAATADLAELRLDYMPEYDLPRLLESRPCPVIVTNRPEREGGRFTGGEEGRLAALREAITLGADYVDVESDAVRSASFLRGRGETKLIVSYHNFEETPENLASLWQELSGAGADLVKMATMATSLTDNLRMFQVIQNAAKPTIGLCMGELGVISRILYRRFGGYLTFACMGEGPASGPGQLTVDEFRNVYNVDSVDAESKIYGVIGNPIAHSMSPAIHNAAFKHRGMNCIYVPFRVEDVVEFVNRFDEIDVQGYSVTIPHKEAAMTLMDEIDPVAQSIGVVNTIVKRDGRRLGYNTDWLAAIKGLEDAMGGEAPLQGKKCVILGAGGAARALAFGLRERDAQIAIVNRTQSRGEKLAGEVGGACVPVSDVGGLEMEVVLNTTSVGMHPNVDDTPLDAQHLQRGLVVFDAVYNPLETRLLREARERGCTTVTGFEMFVNQAVEQFELWTGDPAPVEVMAEVVRRRLTGKP